MGRHGYSSNTKKGALYLRDIVFHSELLLYTETHYMEHEKLEGERVEGLLALELISWWKSSVALWLCTSQTPMVLVVLSAYDIDTPHPH